MAFVVHVFVCYEAAGVVVGLMTSIWTGWSGAQIPVGARDFSLHQNIWACCGALLIHLLSVYWYSFLGVKLLGHEINDSPVSCAMVKNELSYISTPPVSLARAGRTLSFLYLHML